MNQKTREALYGIKLVYVQGDISPDFWDEFPHSHEHCEIFLHVCGELDIFVEQNLYHLSGGEIRVYRTNELHCGKTEHRQHMEWYQLSVPREFLDQVENSVLKKALFDRDAGAGNVFTIEDFSEAVSALHHAIMNDGELTSHLAYAAAIQVLCMINGSKRVALTDKKNEALRRLTDAVNINFKSISTVEELSLMTHYSTCYINKIFKAYLNVTPYKFILAKKLNEAKNAMQSGMDISRACEYAGFNDYANFITLFKKHFGITPKKWITLYSDGKA